MEAIDLGPKTPPSTKKEMEETIDKMLEDSNVYKCEKCGSTLFTQKIMIREVSGFQYGLGTQMIPLTVPVIVCDKCGEICKYSKEEMNDKTQSLSGLQI